MRRIPLFPRLTLTLLAPSIILPMLAMGIGAALPHREIAYIGADSASKTRIYLLDVNSGLEQPLTPPADYASLAWSPDGRSLAWQP